MAIKTIMLGASRVGKTAILASMLENARREDVRGFFEIRDESQADYAAITDISRRESVMLPNSIAEMSDMVASRTDGGRTLSGLMGTSEPFDYKLSIKSKFQDGSNRIDTDSIEVHFQDIPGERFNSSALGFGALLTKVKEAQILIVAVDAPAIKWVKDEIDNNRGGAVLNMALNRPDEVLEAVTNLGQEISDNNLMRMVIFVPVKCEYWIHNNKIDEIYEAIKYIYRDSIDVCGRYPDMRTMIMPVETIGGISFDYTTPENKSFILKYGEDNRPAMYISEDKVGANDVVRCEKIDDDTVRLKNGVLYELKESDELIPASSRNEHPYCSAGKVIPYTWYKKLSGGRYTPEGCDQVFFKVIDFAIESTIMKYVPIASNTGFELADKLVELFQKFWTVIVMILSRVGLFSNVNTKLFLQNIKLMNERGVINDSNCMYLVKRENSIDKI